MNRRLILQIMILCGFSVWQGTVKAATPPQIIAHRGLSGEAPESTLFSYRAAARLPVDALEGDVQRTKDGRLVIFHDDNLLRTSDVKNKFPNRASYTIQDFTWEELQSLDTGSWFNKKYKNKARSEFVGAKMVELRELVAIAEQSHKDIYLEIKSPEKDQGIEEDLARFFQQRGWLDSTGRALRSEKIVFQSFSRESLVRLKALMPESDRLYLLPVFGVKNLRPEEVKAFANRIAPFGVVLGLNWLNPLHLLGLHKSLEEIYQEQGLTVEPWTVNSKLSLQFMNGWVKPDAIFTDNGHWLAEIQQRDFSASRVSHSQCSQIF